MNYQKHYDTLIERARNRHLEGYSETHHILPRCLGGNNEDANLVKLTAEEHYVAHLLLCKMYPTNGRLAFAANMMSNSNSNLKRNNKSYTWVRKKMADHMRHNNPNAGGISRREYVKKHGHPVCTREHITDKFRNKCREAKLGELNPNFAIPPWRHAKATTLTIDIWRNAQRYFEWWKQTGRSYHRMAKEFGFQHPTMSHHNLIKRFKAGWVPNQDEEWKQYYV